MALGILTSNLRTLKNLKLTDIQLEKVLGMMSSKVNPDDQEYAHITQKKTKCQLVLLSAAVCGIEFCYAAETAFVTPTLLQIGVPVYLMSLIWCLSPILGFFLVPVLGSLSDRCKWKLGRRRPFILLLSLGIIIGLVLVPSGKDIGVHLGDHLKPEETSIKNGYHGYNGNETVDPVYHTNTSYTSVMLASLATTVSTAVKFSNTWTILFTVIGVVLLDFSCDSCQSPCRAYMLDVTIPADHSAGLSTFTVLAGFGGAIGYAVGGINWGSTTVSSISHVRIVFSVVLVMYIICVLLTVTSVREVPLGKLGLSKATYQTKKKKRDGETYSRFVDEDDAEDEKPSISSSSRLGPQKPGYGTCDEITRVRSEGDIMQMKQLNHNGVAPPDGRSVSKDDTYLPPEENIVPITANDVETAEPPEDFTHDGLPMASEISLKTYLISIIRLPRSLAMLCLTNLFCWMSLVCYSLYFTDFVGQAVFGGDPSAPTSSESNRLYKEGVRTGSLAMSLYSLSCSAYSLSIETLIEKFGTKRVYVTSQLMYTLGSLALGLCPHYVAAFVLSPAAGVMYATLFTVPYLLVAHYHSSDTFEELVEGQRNNSHVRGLGTDVALLSSMVFVAQFFLSLVMGSIIHATGSTSAVMFAASILSFCGALTATQVTYLDL